MSDPNMHLHSSGSVECKVCLSVHANQTAYISHTQGKLHNENVQKYTHKTIPIKQNPKPKTQARIQKLPKYDIIKLRDPKHKKLGIRAEFHYDELTDPKPKYRIMSSYEQSVEEFDPKYQYLVVVGKPYSACAVRLPAGTINKDQLIEYYDKNTKKYYVQFLFDDLK